MQSWHFFLFILGSFVLNPSVSRHFALLAIFSLCYFSCAKKEPEPAAISAPVKKITQSHGDTLPQANSDQELANELREPDMLNQLDSSLLQNDRRTVSNPTRTNNHPVVIKGSDKAPEMVEPKTPAPAPPVPAPSVPKASDTTAKKIPGAGN